tara:strand:+ start:124 stop:231 length:108 start_codon:yes stop_codon:yes gene_type:complete
MAFVSGASLPNWLSEQLSRHDGDLLMLWLLQSNQI